MVCHKGKLIVFGGFYDVGLETKRVPRVPRVPHAKPRMPWLVR